MRSADDITAMWKAWNINQISKFHSTAALAGARQKPYVRTRNGLE